MVKGSLQVLRGSRFDSLLLHFVLNLIKMLMVGKKNSINVDHNNKNFLIFLKICFFLIISVGLTPASFYHFCVVWPTHNLLYLILHSIAWA